MHAPLTPVPKQVQRKCACEGGGAACACPDKKKVQRKARVSEPDDVHEAEADRFADEVTRGGGLAGFDFSRVRIHDDANAHALADSHLARAFTYGSDIYFARGERNAPDGQWLLAHEVAHTMQQGAGDVVQRKVAGNYEQLKTLLSRSFRTGNWAITDKDVRKALGILTLLKDTSEIDFADTVKQMEADGLVDRLFREVAKEDKLTYEKTLQDVQNQRQQVSEDEMGRKKIVTDSCPPERRRDINVAAGTAGTWILGAVRKIDTWLIDPDAEAAAGVATAIRNHFNTLDPAYVRKLSDQLNELFQDMHGGGGFSLECSAPTDPRCEKYPAYTRRTSRVIRFCDDFFEDGPKSRATDFLHEATHAFLEDLGGTDRVEDRAYLGERLYSFLSPDEAFDNADSYSNLVAILGGDRKITIPENDDVITCKDEMEVRRIVARAERWNTDVLTTLRAPTLAARHEPLRRKYFGTGKEASAPELVEVYEKFDDVFQQPIKVICETSCKEGKWAWTRSFGALHICPEFFNFSAEERIARMYRALFRRSRKLMSEEKALRYADLAHELIAGFETPAPPLTP